MSATAVSPAMVGGSCEEMTSTCTSVISGHACFASCSSEADREVRWDIDYWTQYDDDAHLFYCYLHSHMACYALCASGIIHSNQTIPLLHSQWLGRRNIQPAVLNLCVETVHVDMNNHAPHQLIDENVWRLVSHLTCVTDAGKCQKSNNQEKIRYFSI
jgi:hypothetical protein